jgi:RsiW-degrading membrane proteinase PrsW (M82 family)
MNWHYTIDEEVVGPLSEQTMMELRAAGMLEADTRVCEEGSEDWVLYMDAFKNRVKLPAVPQKPKNSSLAKDTWTKVADGVSSAAGLEKLEGPGARSLFGSLFRKRTLEEVEDSFAVGTRLTTPAIDKVDAQWPAPWVFMRLLGFSVIATIGFYWAINRFDNFLLYPGWLFMGAFAVPFSVMFFFIETNVLRNISFYRVLKLLFLGGLMSLIFALIFFETTAATQWFGVMAAGPVEELAKVLAVVFVAKNWKHTHWTLNGMLLGAAVGAGFAAFETAGYILNYAMTSGESEGPVMIIRALHAPFTHIIWTAATAGALWRFKGTHTFSFSMLMQWPVLRVLLLVMGLHALWNSPLVAPIVGDFLGTVLKWGIIGLLGWILVLLLIQSGLNQVKAAQSEETPGAPDVPDARDRDEEPTPEPAHEPAHEPA